MRSKSLFAIVVCAFGGLALSVSAEGLEVNGSVSATMASAHFWRGKEINDDAILQPEITLTIDRWTLSAMGTWDVKGGPESSVRTRVDVKADYGIEYKNLLIKAGAVVRVYHDDPGNRARDTYEVYAQAAADLPLYPSVTIYYDFGTINGFYASLAASEMWEVQNWMDLNLDVSLGVASSGFNQKFFAGPSAGEDGDTTLRGGLVDVSGSVSLPMKHKAFIVTPKVEYVALIDSALRDVAEAAGKDYDQVIGSLTVSWSF